ncbi:hypothetical protein FJZ26_01065 [Candidatus Parvarchaeota archaeon]|nr:hypothetical protein [Candidatus Parvarchaeota archaeon]
MKIEISAGKQGQASVEFALFFAICIALLSLLLHSVLALKKSQDARISYSESSYFAAKNMQLYFSLAFSGSAKAADAIYNNLSATSVPARPPRLVDANEYNPE